MAENAGGRTADGDRASRGWCSHQAGRRCCTRTAGMHVYTHPSRYPQVHVCAHNDNTHMHTHTCMCRHTDTYMHMHAHMSTWTHPYTYSHTHARTHPHLPAHMHKHTHTYTFMDVHTCIHTQTHAHAYTHAHTQRHTYTNQHPPFMYTHPCMPAHTHTHRQACARARTHTHMSAGTSIHAYTDTHTHTYLHTHEHTLIPPLSCAYMHTCTPLLQIQPLPLPTHKCLSPWEPLDLLATLKAGLAGGTTARWDPVLMLQQDLTPYHAGCPDQVLAMGHQRLLRPTASLPCPVPGLPGGRGLHGSMGSCMGVHGWPCPASRQLLALGADPQAGGWGT